MNRRIRLSDLKTTQFAGVALFVFSTGFPPLDGAAEADLTLHMLQHVLIVFSGIAVAYPFFRRRLSRAAHAGLIPGGVLLLASAIVVFWHFPLPWDSAVISPWVHVVEHFSFLVVGLFAGSWLLLLSDSAKIGALLAAFFGHMGYAVALISPWNVKVYEFYPLPNQIILGWVLLLTGPLLIVGIAYVIARNPGWLAGVSASGNSFDRRETFVNRVKAPRWAAPLLSAVLLLVLAGYFVVAIAASNAGIGIPRSEPVVYILETPVSWAYSPQNVTVIVGVNNTVTWVSRSISFDTVTGTAPGFESGPIAPGQTFRFTFPQPGVYDYRCLYHPWMTGTVIVLAS